MCTYNGDFTHFIKKNYIFPELWNWSKLDKCSFSIPSQKPIISFEILLEFFCNLVFRFCSRINQGINPQHSYLDRFLPSFWACTHLEAPFWAFMKEQGMIRAPISKFLVFLFVIIKSFLINQKSWLLLLVGTGVLVLNLWFLC